ncbi:concanavalin A-like lectin/glucanase [Aureococcus anophagefferens]|nr:concanavalin A-like lectin/glucanase [Aureococcus anophagefferens]
MAVRGLLALALLAAGCGADLTKITACTWEQKGTQECDTVCLDLGTGSGHREVCRENLYENADNTCGLTMYYNSGNDGCKICDGDDTGGRSTRGTRSTSAPRSRRRRRAAASTDDDTVACYENDGSQSFAFRIITYSATHAHSVFAIDVDGDGDVDPLSTSVMDDTVAWYENSGSDWSFAERIITTLAGSARALYAMDIDGDVDVDSFTERIISTLASSARGIYAIDVDGDGDVDALSAREGDDTVAWYENDGSQSFTERIITTPRTTATPNDGAQHFTTRIITTLAEYAKSVDAIGVGGDGDVDVLAASSRDDTIAWSLATASLSLCASSRRRWRTGSSPSSRSTPTARRRRRLSASYNDDTVAWYENDGSESFTARVITTLASAAFDVFAVDVDGDGDVGVLSASSGDHTVAWHENDGSQSFTMRAVTLTAVKVRSTVAIDVDGDGNHTLSVLAMGAWSVFAIDVDGDGDVDVLWAGWYEDTVAWYENAGAGSFFPAARVITTLASYTYAVFAVDVDGDGDVDALSADEGSDEVAWYENGGSQSFTKLVVASDRDGAYAVFAIDLDGDGDSFTEHVLTTLANLATSVYAIDVDGDGDVDALSASADDDTIAWYENDCEADGSLDGTINGATATTGRDGSGALAFDGTDDYVEFPAAVTADIQGSSSRTVCLWAVINAFAWGTLFSYDSNADQKRFGFMTESTAGEFRLLGYGDDYDFLNIAVSGSDDGDWHHYCHTYDGTDWLLYFDATLVHTETVALDTGSDNPLTLGVRYSAGLSGYFDGSIDEVYVYASALDAASIQVLYDVVTAAPTPDGTISGATATTGQYGIGGALSFDGTDDYVEFPSAVTADIQGSNARTVCLWAVINSFSSDGSEYDLGAGLFDYGDYSDLENFALRVHGTDGSLRVQLWGADTDVALSGSDDGDWHHYCLTYDGSDWALYFDGTQAATGTEALDTGSDNALRLGQWNSNYYLDGSIDEFYVYASALDAAPRRRVLPFDDGEAEDDYGELDGTIEGATATTGRDGSGALSFDGVDDYVEFPSAVTADILGNSDRTLCLWLQRDTTSWEDGTFFTYGDDGVAYGSFALRSNCCSENVLVERHGNDDNWDLSVSGLDDGGWHHVCMTRPTRSASVRGWVFTGSIDEVYVYASALDAASIQVLYDVVTAAPTVTPLPTHVSHSTLVAHYSFDDGTAAEDSDGSLDGTINGATATTGRDGSGALSFDGSDDYVEFPSAVTADILGNSARTLCLWALIDDFDGGALFSYDSNADQKRFGFMTESTAGEFRLLGSGEDYDFLDVAASGSDDGDWHHYCHTYDGTDWLLYFDATLVHTETVALDTGSDNPLTLGVRYSAGLAATDGSIDEVYVYASALDAASIQVLYDVVTAAPTPDGTISGATATTGQYGIGGALSFDGTDDYVEFPSAVTADIQGSNARTVCLWAVINSFSSDGSEYDLGAGLFDYGDYSDLENFALRVHGTDGSLRVQLWGADTDVALSGSDDGDWHHYCLTYDGSDWALYFDGTQAATGTEALDTGSDNALRLGQWNSNYYLDGSIDEFYVYASALDAASIQALYDAVTVAPTRDTTSWEDGTFFTYGDDGVASGPSR